MKIKNILLNATIASILAMQFAIAVEQPKPASSYTKEVNQKFYKYLNFSDKQDYSDADRGLVKTFEEQYIKDSKGNILYDYKSSDFLNTENKVPDTANPSLWRVSQLTNKKGLYKVTDGIYQVRGLDISNMTIIETKKGIIVIDPLTFSETAKVALDLYYENVPQPKTGNRPIKAVIYTHSHVDHFGGVKGVIDEKDVKSGKIKVIAPEGFLEESISENVYAGNAMNGRAKYMYGKTLPKGEKGYLSVGLGLAAPDGSIGLIAPNEIIKKDRETKTIDGVKIEFQLAPGTEAPAEMLMYFPQFKALCAAEDATHNLHNLYTLRGAQVRKADNWWKTLDIAIQRFGDKTDVIFAQHHWPKWGRENIVKFLEDERDGWKYLNDRTLNLANKGYTPNEIAEMVSFPKELDTQWYMRGYYGSVSHNTKAVYQRYLGWYDSNPANLNALPPVEAGKRYVEVMGGEANVIKKAKEYYNRGDYRFAAEILKHVVFSNPKNMEARNLQADTFEQLGYQSENGTWRNEYLVAAKDLREGTVKTNLLVGSPDLLAAMSNEMIIDYLSISLNTQKSEGKKMKINWTNGKEKIGFELRNSILVYRNGVLYDQANLGFEADNLTVLEIFANVLKIDDAINSGKLKIIVGTTHQLQDLVNMMDSAFDPNFNIVLP